MSNFENAPYLKDLGTALDDRGSIYFSESDTLPFNPVRFFFINPSSDESVRGQHGHHECWQFIFPVNNKIFVTALHKGVRMEIEVEVGKGLVVPPKNWCEIRFSDKNTTLVVLASHPFEKEDYFYEDNFYSLD